MTRYTVPTGGGVKQEAGHATCFTRSGSPVVAGVSPNDARLGIERRVAIAPQRVPLLFPVFACPGDYTIPTVVTLDHPQRLFRCNCARRAALQAQPIPAPVHLVHGQTVVVVAAQHRGT